MPTRFRIRLLLGLAGFAALAGPANAQGNAGLPPPGPPPLPPQGLPERPPAPPPDLPDANELIGQLRQLEDLLQLPPDKLERLAQTIQYIRNMDAVEREAMRIRLRQITQLTPELDREIRTLATHLPPEERANLSQFWLVADEDKREAFRQQLAAASPSQIRLILRDAVTAFVLERDRVFDQMRQSLLQKTPPSP